MRIASLILTAALCTCGLPAFAASQADASYIAKHVISDQTRRDIRTAVAEALVDVYADELAKKSVKVRDHARFAQMLPDSVTDDWVRMIERHAAKNCLTKLPEHEISQAADYMRAHPDWDSKGVANPNDAHARATSAMMVCVVFMTSGIKVQVRQSNVDAHLRRTAPLAKILGTFGVVNFPNRILRDKFLQEIRHDTGE